MTVMGSSRGSKLVQMDLVMLAWLKKWYPTLQWDGTNIEVANKDGMRDRIRLELTEFQEGQERESSSAFAKLDLLVYVPRRFKILFLGEAQGGWFSNDICKCSCRLLCCTSFVP